MPDGRPEEAESLAAVLGGEGGRAEAWVEPSPANGARGSPRCTGHVDNAGLDVERPAIHVHRVFTQLWTRSSHSCRHSP